MSNSYSEEELKEMHLDSTKRIAKELNLISHLHWEEGIIEVYNNSNGFFIDKDDYEELMKKLKGLK